MFNKSFWKDALERSVATAAQSVVAVIGVDAVSALDLDYKKLAGIAAGGALLSLLKAVSLSDRHTTQAENSGGDIE